MSEAKVPVVFIATPMYGGQALGTYTASLMQCPMTFARNGIGMYGVNDVFVRRNSIRRVEQQ